MCVFAYMCVCVLCVIHYIDNLCTHHMFTAEWQVMCVFKAMHTNPSEQHAELSEKEFYNFYEVQNFKWREVCTIMYMIE